MRKPCKYIEITPDAAGRVVWRKDAAHKCTRPAAEPVLPASITGYVGWRWPPPRAFVTREDCEGCPVWQEREAK